MKEQNDNLFEAAFAFWYNIVYSRRLGRALLKKAQRLREKRRKEPEMTLSLREFVIQIGKEEGRKEGLKEGFQKGLQKGLQKGRKEQEKFLQKALSSLRKVLKRKGIDPAKYEKDLSKIKDPGKIVQLLASLASAKNPEAYMKRRFGH